MVAAALLLEAQGRTVAPVPLWATTVLGSMPIARVRERGAQGIRPPGVVAGDTVLTAALTDVAGDIALGDPAVRRSPASQDPTGWSSRAPPLPSPSPMWPTGC